MNTGFLQCLTTHHLKPSLIGKTNKIFEFSTKDAIGFTYLSSCDKKNYFVIQCNQKIRKAPHKYNKERLGINEVKQEYVNISVNQIPEADEKNNLNWALLQQIVINTADEVIGKWGKNGKEWI